MNESPYLKKFDNHLQSEYTILFQGRKGNSEILRFAASAYRQDDMKV